MSAVERVLRDLPIPTTSTAPEPSWPTLDPRAFHGPAGTFALEADPFTEADPIAVLVTVLAGSGAIIGRGPFVYAGNDRHPAAVWPVLVGQTAKGGKGTSFAAARSALAYADPDFYSNGPSGQVLGGFNSGESVVDALRDPDPAAKDEGRRDPRMLVYEPEFARLMKAAGREGSTLSMLLRDGWDQRRLETRSRSKVVTASNYHLVTIGHITVHELRSRLTDSETYGGFTNRFLWTCVRRSKRLPEGGNVPDDVSLRCGEAIATAVGIAAARGRMERTPAARARWAELYDEMGDDDPGGMLGAATARAEPMTLRLSLLYALLDGAEVIDVPHLEAASALWRYCRESAAFIFGEARGDPMQDKLLVLIRDAGEGGLTFTEQSKALGGHRAASEIDAARKALLAARLIREWSEQTGGRAITVNAAVAKEAKQANGVPPPMPSRPSSPPQEAWPPPLSDDDAPPEFAEEPA